MAVVVENNVLEVINRLYPSFEFKFEGDISNPQYSMITAIKGTLTEADWDKCVAEYDRCKYQRDRMPGYKSAKEQLDQLWHAIDDGLELKDSDFYKDNKAVKDANPKP